ncbi:MAG TPA: nucleotidyltransferase family protein [Burkholderiales bacterium]|nr:nucleotidyltransferase family protein [Burkholderiales bacterium]
MLQLLPVAILAGGVAMRMRPLTQTRPKALIEVGGEPFVCHQLAYLRDQGVTNVVLCVGYLGSMIEEVVGNGAAFGLTVRYVYDGDRLLGTGGALKRALPLLQERFFVLYGDSYLPCDFRAVQQAFSHSGKLALMTVLRNEGRWDASNVLFEDGRIVAYDKRNPTDEMAHIDYGLGILSAPIFDAYQDGEVFDLADLYHALSRRGQLVGLEVQQRFYEIGSPQGLKDAEAYFSTKEKI